MKPELTDLWGGIAGCTVSLERFEIGEGVVISQTYAHFMAPFLMAFNPAQPGKPHPPPWKAAKGGLSFDINAEIYLPVALNSETLDRVNTIWWIAALLRLKATTSLFVPVLSSEKFSAIPHIEQEPELIPIEIQMPRITLESQKNPKIGVDELEWLKRYWVRASKLLANEDFSMAFQAVDSCIWNSNPALALVAVWGALERLFSASRQELSFRVSANIASFLEPPGRERYKCFKHVKGLYAYRSKAAHGAGANDIVPLLDSYKIARRVLLQMIESHHVPDKNELEAGVFGDEIRLADGSGLEEH